MSDFLEHVMSPVETLRIAHSLLGPTGVILLTTPNTASLSRKLMGFNWTHYKLEHLFYFNPHSLGAVAQRAGFRLSSCRSAAKTMNINYIYSQLSEYRHWLITPLARAVVALGRPLAAIPLDVTMGEMAAILQKVTP
jgi:hypothetical protein